MRKLRLRESERLFKGHTVEAGAPGEMGGLAPPWAPPRRPQKAVLPRAGRKAEAPPRPRRNILVSDLPGRRLCFL